MANDYAVKLKDPRWQKRRLEIFERDEWTCQKCFDSESTLVVHHRRYLNGNEPWDYPDALLITLCEDCHEGERENMARTSQGIVEILREKFLAEDMHTIKMGFCRLELQHSPEIVAATYEWALSDPTIQRELIDRYFKTLKKNKRGKANGQSST